MSLNRRTFFGWLSSAVAAICVFARGAVSQAAKPTNETVQSVDLQSPLRTDFSRNQENFAVNQYCQIVPVENPVGIWYQHCVDAAHELAFLCKRRSYTSHGRWTNRGLVERQSRCLAQKAMTFRTISVINLLVDPKQWTDRHVLDLKHEDAPFSFSDDWSASTSARLTIKRCLNYADQQILIDGRASVNLNDFRLIMSPATQAKIVSSHEFRCSVREGKSELTQSPSGKSILTVLCEKRVIIEDTIVVTSQRGEVSPSIKFALPDGIVVMTYRPKESIGIEGSNTNSTVAMHVVANEELCVEEEFEKISVVDNFSVNMTAPINGFLFLNVC